MRGAGGARSFFGPSLEQIDGGELERDRLDASLPDNIQQLCSATEGIVRAFDLVRVDFFHTDGLPMLGELSFCHRNALVTFTPESFDAYVRKALFE